MQNDLSTGSVLRHVLSFSLPLALGMASHAAFNLVDLFIVGRLGQEAVAGVHLGTTINFFPMILGNGLSIGTTALLAHACARRDYAAGQRVANLSLLVQLGLSLLIGFGCWLFATPLVELQAASGQSAILGVEYLEILSLGTFTMFVLIHVSGVLRAIGNAFWPVVLLLGSNVLNIALDYLLIFGVEAWGVPAMGVAGAAWATVASRAAGCVVGLLVLASRRSPLRPGLSLPRVGSAVLGRIARLGVPQSFQMLVRASLVLTITRIAGRLGGEPALSAIGICTRLDSFILFGAVGWASGTTAIVSQCLARGRRLRCQRVAWSTALVAGTLALAVGLVYALLAEPLCRYMVTGAGPDLVGHARLYLQIVAFGHPAMTASLVLAGALNGAGRSVTPMLVDLVVIGALLQPALWLWDIFGSSGGLGACWLQVTLACWLLFGAYMRWMRAPTWMPVSDLSAKLSVGSTED